MDAFLATSLPTPPKRLLFHCRDSDVSGQCTQERNEQLSDYWRSQHAHRERKHQNLGIDSTWDLKDPEGQAADLHRVALSHTSVHQWYALSILREANDGAAVGALKIRVATDVVVVVMRVENVVQ